MNPSPKAQLTHREHVEACLRMYQQKLSFLVVGQTTHSNEMTIARHHGDIDTYVLHYNNESGSNVTPDEVKKLLMLGDE